MKLMMCSILAVLTLGLTPVWATDYAVEMTCYGWEPESITINTGDRVFFWNSCPGNAITVAHLSGPCTPWASGIIPWSGYAVHTFDCAPGTEIYIENSGVFYYQGTIIIQTPGPTATPNSTPAMTPIGTGILLALMGVLMTVGMLKRNR